MVRSMGQIGFRHRALRGSLTDMVDTKCTPPIGTDSEPGGISVEQSSRRTGMSFQRTRMSADRTLMSVIRTSLALIGFGFTIFQFFEKLKEAGTLSGTHAARNFGLALVALGIAMLVLGIVYHFSSCSGYATCGTR
jgi:putative membrane protein